MYKIFYSLISIVWVLDILDMPFMSFLDVEFPINTLGWFLILIVLPGTESFKVINNQNKIN